MKRLPPSRQIDNKLPVNSIGSSSPESPTSTNQHDLTSQSLSDTEENNAGIEMKERLAAKDMAVDEIMLGLGDRTVTAQGVLETRAENGETILSRRAQVAPADLAKQYGKSKAKKIAAGTLVVEDGKIYDMSLLKAMFATVWFQWSFAILLNACAGK